MQIALTKKLTDALNVTLPAVDETIDPLFTWTANWTTVWDNRKAEDMLVLVNNATRFTVAMYQVKRKDLKNIEKMLKPAIENTLLSINLNPELVNEYMRLAGELEFVRNNSRKTAAWVSKAGLECAFHIGREYNGVLKMYCDTLGALANYRIVNSSGKIDNGFYPYKAMVDILTEQTGIQAYKCRAFELMVSLDLEVYSAERKLIVPANIKLSQLHRILQYIFGWTNSHLYEFSIMNSTTKKVLVRLLPTEGEWIYDEKVELVERHSLADFLPEHEQIIYTYDLGDHWEHCIRLIRIIDEYDGELPYLLDASGQAPPEDVGGVGGFVNFREIMLNPEHPEYAEVRKWSGYWKPELSDWERKPRVIHL